MFKWIHQFFEHFLDTFKNICDETQWKINYLIDCIDEKYSKNMSKLDEMTRNGYAAACQYNGEYGNITFI